MKDVYRVQVKRTAQNELRELSKKDLVWIVDKMKGLGMQPRPRGCKKMTGAEHFRIRQGDWRIVYQVDDEARTVTVIKLGHRSEVYR